MGPVRIGTLSLLAVYPIAKIDMVYHIGIPDTDFHPLPSESTPTECCWHTEQIRPAKHAPSAIEKLLRCRCQIHGQHPRERGKFYSLGKRQLHRSGAEIIINPHHIRTDLLERCLYLRSSSILGITHHHSHSATTHPGIRGNVGSLDGGGELPLWLYRHHRGYPHTSGRCLVACIRLNQSPVGIAPNVIAQRNTLPGELRYLGGRGKLLELDEDVLQCSASQCGAASPLLARSSTTLLPQQPSTLILLWHKAMPTKVHRPLSMQ